MVNLVVVAHPDDEVLGFGATGANLAERGETVVACIVCGGVNAGGRRPEDEYLLEDIIHANELLGFERPILGDFPNIEMNCVPHLRLVQFIEDAIAATGAQNIYTHHFADLNNDHEQVSKACLAASRLFQRRASVSRLLSLRYMEILSATDWSFSDGSRQFTANTFAETGAGLDKKIAALACYRDVMRDFPHPRSKEIITALAAYRGGQAGVKYAEAFQTIFSTIQIDQ